MGTNKIQETYLYHYEKALDYFTNQNKTEEAIKEYKEVIRLKPDYAQAYFDLAYIYSLINESLSAAKYYKGYLKLSPFAKDHNEVKKIINVLSYNIKYNYAMAS
jgi:tetratricopeptide (TPR) repeat protein